MKRYQLGECPSSPLFLLDFWQNLCGPPKAEKKLRFGLLSVAGFAEAVAVAAEVLPAGSADIAGNAGAVIRVITPSELVIKLGCMGKDFPYHTSAEGIHLEVPLVSEGHNRGRNPA